MKLTACHIVNFGKLHDLHLTFQDGINVIHRENGWGKTTLAAFIKAMFYGMTSTTKRSVLENERKKYLPWQGGRYGGSLSFENEHGVYQIERFFGEKDKDDTFLLYDQTTGLISNDYSEHVGEELFGINMEGYERSAYIPQLRLGITANDSINAKLSHLLDDGNDINHYESALLALDEAMKLYKKTGNRGKLGELEQRLHAIERELERTAGTEKALIAWEDRLRQRKDKQQQLEQEIRQTKEQTMLAAGYEARQAKREHYTQLLAEKDRIEAVGKNLREMFVESTTDRVNDRNQDDTVKFRSVFAAIVAATVCLSAVILIIVTKLLLVGVITAVVGIGLWILYLILHRQEREQEKRIKQQQQTMEQERARQKQREQELLQKNKEEFEQCLHVIEMFEQENQFGKDRSDSDTFPEQAQIESLSDLQVREQKLIQELDSIKIEIMDLERKIDDMNQILEVRVDQESERFELIEKLKQGEEHYDILSDTVRLIKQAKDRLSTNYFGNLQKRFQHYIEELCDSLSDSAGIDTKFTVKVSEEGTKRDLDYFSEGYKDLVSLCARFALIDVLFSGEHPLVVLDDPFSNLDEEKLAGVLQLLNTISHDYQILYFVCHNSRMVKE